MINIILMICIVVLLLFTLINKKQIVVTGGYGNTDIKSWNNLWKNKKWLSLTKKHLILL